MLHVQKRISEAVYRRPDEAFQEVQFPGKDKGHVTTKIDLEAQDLAEKFLLETKLGIKTQGEETPEDKLLDLSKEQSPVVIMDMIDGTDLFTREMGNWCSAMVVLHPPTAEILGALVGLPLGDQFKLYMAARSFDSADLLTYDILPTKSGELRYLLPEVEGGGIRHLAPRTYEPETGKLLNRTSIAFYGQKRSRLVEMRDKTNFPWSEELAESDKLRIYTLAGNPMLAKLAEGRISAVFEAFGQKPYDCIPVLFIAQKAGAVVKGPDRSSIDLGAALKKGEKVRYIAACQERLLNDLAPMLVK